MQLTPVLSFRPAIASDEPFLADVFLRARPELAALPQALVQLQRDAQRHQYDDDYPNHRQFVVSVERPIGAFRCWQDASEHRLLDLAVLPGYRFRGVGRRVLAELASMASTAGLPLRLSVWSANAPALGLYRSTGFEIYAERSGYLFLQLLPTTSVRAQIVSSREK